MEAPGHAVGEIPGEAEAAALGDAVGEAVADVCGEAVGAGVGVARGAAVVPGLSLGIGFVRIAPHILHIHCITPSWLVVGCATTFPASQL